MNSIKSLLWIGINILLLILVFTEWYWIYFIFILSSAFYELYEKYKLKKRIRKKKLDKLRQNEIYQSDEK